jgi:hypothetical protein
MQEELTGLITIYSKLRGEKDSVNQILKDLNEKIESLELKNCRTPTRTKTAIS